MVKHYSWYFTLKRLNKDAINYRQPDGSYAKYDSCTTTSIRVSAPNINEAIKLVEEEMNQDEFLKQYTICDVHNSTFYPI